MGVSVPNASAQCGRRREPDIGWAGGAETRQAAAKQALEAIEFTLESENDAEPPADGEIGYVQVSIEVG